MYRQFLAILMCSIGLGLGLNATIVENVPFDGDTDLNIHISKIKKVQGALRVALMDSKHNYDKVIGGGGKKGPEYKPFKGQVIPVESDTMTVTFNNLPSGDYAFVIVHDLNLNEKLDMGLFGPSEPIVFSNNLYVGLGAPKYEQTRFSLSPTQNSVSVNY
jgi:uncharacterized protein (DUF2141 family)